MDEQLRQKAKPASYPAPEAEPKDREVLKVINELLPVELSKEQLLEVGRELAAQIGELTSHAANKKEVLAGLKSRETAIQAQIDRLHLQLINGTRTQEVPVRLEADFTRNLVEYRRADTEVVIRERPLAPEERQGILLPETGDGLPSGVTRADIADIPDEDGAL